ncbi:unnamed protein product, partial [Ectocarpus sp. 12 AP-2014]
RLPLCPPLHTLFAALCLSGSTLRGLHVGSSGALAGLHVLISICSRSIYLWSSLLFSAHRFSLMPSHLAPCSHFHLFQIYLSLELAVIFRTPFLSHAFSFCVWLVHHIMLVRTESFALSHTSYYFVPVSLSPLIYRSVVSSCNNNNNNNNSSLFLPLTCPTAVYCSFPVSQP